MNFIGSSLIQKKILSGVGYTAIARYSGILIQLIVTAILARLLTPHDFGIIAISLIFINFFAMISEMGFGPAIIQNKNLLDKDLINIFSFTAYLGLLLSFLLIAISFPISQFYNEVKLIKIIQLLCINIFFSTINIVPNAILLKQQKFKFIAVRTFVVQLITGVFAIIAALVGFGIYALLITPILSSIIVFFINFQKVNLKFKLLFSFLSINKILGYSLYQFLFNFINYFSRNADKLLIGRILGLRLLAFYEKSYALMLLPIANITSILNPVLQPVFSEFQDQKNKLSSYYLKIVKFLAIIGFPLSVLLYFSAREIIIIIYGDQWIQAIPVFQIMSISVAFQIISSSSGSIYQASNCPKLLFVSGLISAIINLTGILVAIFFFKTIEAVAISIVITFTFNFFQNYFILFNMVLKTGLSRFLKTLLVPVLAAVIICIALYSMGTLFYINNVILSLSINSLISLLIVIAIYRFTHLFHNT